MYTIDRRREWNKSVHNERMSFAKSTKYDYMNKYKPNLSYEQFLNKYIHNECMSINQNKQKTPYQFQVMKELYTYFWNTLNGYKEFIYFNNDVKLIVIKSITEHMFIYETITNELHLEKYELLNSKLPKELSLVIYNKIDEDFTERDIYLSIEHDKNKEDQWEDMYHILNRELLTIHDQFYHNQYYENGLIGKLPLVLNGNYRCECNQCFAMINLQMNNQDLQWIQWFNERTEKEKFFFYNNTETIFWISEYNQNHPYYDEIKYQYEYDKEYKEKFGHWPLKIKIHDFDFEYETKHRRNISKSKKSRKREKMRLRKLKNKQILKNMGFNRNFDTDNVKEKCQYRELNNF